MAETRKCTPTCRGRGSSGRTLLLRIPLPPSPPPCLAHEVQHAHALVEARVVNALGAAISSERQNTLALEAPPNSRSVGGGSLAREEWPLDRSPCRVANHCRGTPDKGDGPEAGELEATQRSEYRKVS